MLQIPQYVLEKLRCSICGSYLSTKPIMVRAENQQVCGKCYKLLPADEKEKCVRQIGLESVAEIISFPCRYNNQGCPFRFSLSEEKDHETTCPYRSLMSFPPESSRYSNIETIYNQSLGTSENELHCETDQIKATLTYNIKDQQDFKNLSYKLEIKGNCDQSLVIKNANTQESEEVEINMDGKVFLGSKPELVCSDIKVKPIVTQNIYESLRSYDVREHEARCANCGAIANRNHCLLGHQSCNKCQSNICMNCIQLLERDAKTVCKNYKRGCNETLNIDTAHRHEANCPYNDYKCILEPCSVISTLANIKNHIKDDHTSEVFQTNEVHKKFTNKDDTFVIFCYGNIFKCVYYYYKSFVEFFVTYVGSSDEAVKFYYEIIVNIKGYVISKRSKCCSWNNVMLEKGITFEKTELLGTNEKKLNIEVTFRIINKR